MNLTLLQLRFEFVAITELHLPTYTSPTWRGWLGHALRGTAIYDAFFEGQRPTDSQRFYGSSHIPQPYLITHCANQSGRIKPDQIIDMPLTLFGEAWRTLPILIPAVHQATEHQYLGKGEGVIALKEIYYRWNPQAPWQVLTDLTIQPQPGLVVPPQPHVMELEMMTPLRLLKHKRLMQPDRFEWEFFIRTLVRRITSLAYFHQNHEETIDFNALFANAAEHQIVQKLVFEQNHRYSNRQKKEIPLDGLKGVMELKFTKQDDPLWPWIWMGQYTHNGKSTVMGLGQYQLKNGLVHQPKTS